MRPVGGILLAASNVCPRCGFSNQPGFHFCTNCGSALSAGAPAVGPAAPPPVAPAYAYPPPFAYGPPPMEMERRKQIDRTKTGILLLLIGTLLSWIPIIQFIGFLLLLIGAILVILGRKAFGPAHSRNVIVSIILFVVGIAGSFALGFALAIALVPVILGQTADPNALQNAFTTLFVGEIILAAVAGIASVLFTYQLQNPTGRILLWAGYGSSVGVQVAVFLIAAPLLQDAVSQYIASGDPSALLALQGQTGVLELLSVIPALIFTGANYIAWSRINRGEIPAPAAPPGMPGAMPPAGGVPPGQMPPPIHPQ